MTVSSLIHCHALLSLSFLLDAHGHLGHSQEFRCRVFLEDWLKYFLLVGQVDKHADLTGAVSHESLSEHSHVLHLARPRRWLLEHLLRKIENRTGNARGSPLVHLDFD